MAARHEPRGESSPERRQRRPTAASWPDLLLSARQLAALSEIAATARAGRTGRPLDGSPPPDSPNVPLLALFSGPTGTGKTLAAEMLARELGWELHRVDLAAAGAKSSGETEQHLRRALDAADAAGVVLLLDEADALLGRRGAVADAHDRYANLEVGHLLQRLEGFPGLVILATNGNADLGPAYRGRLRWAIEFAPGGGDPAAAGAAPGPAAEGIAGAPTSIAAFVGRTAQGPADTPGLVTRFAEFEALYGGLAPGCPLGHAVRHFFANGGSRAWIARVVHRDADGVEQADAALTDADVADRALAPLHRGLWLLDRVEQLNLLVIPPLGPGTDVGAATWQAAIAYARSRRAFVLVDPPAAWTTAAAAAEGLSALVPPDSHAALFFPRLLAADPLSGDPRAAFAPAGAVAGLYARTDAERGVWHSPAGAAATLAGVAGLSVVLSQQDQDRLHARGINCLRNLPTAGTVVWGARTLAAGGAAASEWKYVPVRRLALFLEESLVQGTRWAAFEPNDERLWARLRLEVGTFLHELFAQGAFQGATAREAYFVRCDRTTMTQTDIDTGHLQLDLGFAPLKPAEFVLLRLRLRAGATKP